MKFGIATASIAVLGCACAVERDWQPPSETLQLATCARPPSSDGFDLGQVAADRPLLQIPVDTGGGCAAHRFAACWDGSVFDTSPASVRIVLTHDAGGDMCDALLMFDLTLDLTPVLAKYAPPLSIIVAGAQAQVSGTTGSVLIEN